MGDCLRWFGEIMGCSVCLGSESNSVFRGERRLLRCALVLLVSQTGDGASIFRKDFFGALTEGVERVKSEG